MRILALSLVLLAAVASMAWGDARADAARKSIPQLLQDLGCYRADVRKAASDRLTALPRARVLEAAAVLARKSVPPREDDVISAAAVSLSLLAEWKDPRAPVIAAALVDAADPDVREAAAGIMATRTGEAADRFLARALSTWGRADVAGVAVVLRALDEPGRMARADVRAAVLSVLEAPVPPPDARFRYASPAEPPRDGDRRRLWLLRADGCLYLVRHHPFPAARKAVVKALEVPELRIEAVGALAELGGDDAPALVRAVLESDPAPERRLACYRALFRLRADTELERSDARNLFTATVAPSPAWVQGLGAMVALFESRADEPALRVVSIWKLRGEADGIRSAALEAMKKAHPGVFARVIAPKPTPGP